MTTAEALYELEQMRKELEATFFNFARLNPDPREYRELRERYERRHTALAMAMDLLTRSPLP